MHCTSTGCIVHLLDSVFYNVSKLRRACFRQRVSHKPCFRQAHFVMQNLCTSSLCHQIPHVPAPPPHTLSRHPLVFMGQSGRFLLSNRRGVQRKPSLSVGAGVQVSSCVVKNHNHIKITRNESFVNFVKSTQKSQGDPR